MSYNILWGFAEYTQSARQHFVRNRKLRQFLKPILNFNGTERVLDVGCGIGTMGKIIAPFLKNGGEIIGIDLDPALVAYGNRHWARRSQIRLEVGDANQIHFPAGYFDIVVSMGLFEAVPNVDRVFSECLRVLKHPGKIIIVHYNMRNFLERPQLEITDQFYKDLIKGMALAGIDLELSTFFEILRKRKLAVEEFVFTMEYSTEISEAMIHFVENSRKSFQQSKKILEQAFDFNFQFLQHAGWSETDLSHFLNETYSIPAHIKFLKAHLGELYYRRFILNIYKIEP
ncbi:MAG: class I SAM-dependent methyltransferase [Candidatus Helarchaeota archaeon]